MKRLSFISIILAVVFGLNAARIPIYTFIHNPVFTEMLRTASSLDEKEATLMVYMTGSDLESSSAAATKDLQEIVESGIDLGKANVVVFTGGSPKWHSDIPEDANAVLLLTENGFETVDVLKPNSMGAPENLTRFLDYAYRKYPAKTYDLILWDHGNGPVIGYCLDKQYENDTLTLPEMRQALEQSPFSAENKLGFIGFDACLMASAELICTVGDYAEYLISSQETEPNFGWDYEFLKDFGKLSSKELACSAANVYLEYCESYYATKQFFHSDVTLSVVDLSYAEQLRDSVGALFRKAAPDVLSSFSRIAVSRVNTRSFGRASTGSEYDLVDLRCLSEELESFYPEEVQALQALLDCMVICAVANTEQSCGVSLYYPFFNKKYYTAQWKDAYREMNVFPDYLNFLNRYEATWLSADMQELFDGTMNVEQREDGYFLPLSAEQLDVTAEGRYYILRRLGEGVYSPIYVGTDLQITESGILAHFDGNIIFYEDAFGHRDIPALRLTDRIGTKSDYSLIGCFAENMPIGGNADFRMQKCDVQLTVDAADRQVTIKGIYETDPSVEQSTGKKTELDLSEWKLLLFAELPARYLTRSENGRIIGLEDWPTNDSFSGTEIPLADGIRFTIDQLYNDGYEYFLMFELTDVQGSRICSEPLSLTLEQAPPAQEPERTTVTWNGDGTAKLTVGGICLQFGILRDPILQEMLFTITAINDNDFPVELLLQDIILDRFPAKMSDTVFFALDAAEKQSQSFNAVNDLQKTTGLLEPIRFLITAQNCDNYGTLCCELPVELTGFDTVTSVPSRLPILDACADEQVILSEGGIEVRLLGLGFNPERFSPTPESESAELSAFYRIENQTDEMHEVVIPALCINGAQLTTLHNVTDTVKLQPHNICYVRQTAELKKIVTMNIDPDDKDNRIRVIDSIASVSALLVIDDKSTWCPVNLSASGNGEMVRVRGTQLFENTTFRVYRETTAADGQNVRLWIENRSDQTYEYYLLSGDQSFIREYIGPNTIQPVCLSIPADVQTGMKLYLRWYSWEDAYRYSASFGNHVRATHETEPFDIYGMEEGLGQ